MIINTNSWHYRWYAYWVRFGRGNGPGYMENLCHYVRVLLFWAPMTWLDQTYDAAVKAKRVLVALVILLLIGEAVWLLVLAGIEWPTQFVMAMGSLAGLIVTLGVLYYTGKFALTHKLPRPPTLGIPAATRLAVAYGSAKKHRVCPFLSFEEAAD